MRAVNWCMHLANRYGRIPALYMGITLQIISSLLCIFAKTSGVFELLAIGRLFQALGAGVGLKMTFTLVNECYEPKVVSQKIAYLSLAFAIMPGLSVAFGGFLTHQFGWISCFYALTFYGIILLGLVSRLPETKIELDYHALRPSHLISSYAVQFKNVILIATGLLMGSSSSIIYVFAAVAPFEAINLFGLSSAEYGMANLLPPIGLLIGSVCSAQLATFMPLKNIIKVGLIFPIIGVALMIAAWYLEWSPIWSMFMPMIIIYFGTSLIFANASSVAMSTVADKAHASAVLNFLNMGAATVAVLLVGLFPVTTYLLPVVFVGLLAVMILCSVIIIMKN